MQTGKRIPITAAKDIAGKYGYSQVIIHAYDGNTHIQHVTTFGKSQSDCENAAAGGNEIKKLLKWDKSLCNAKPKRQIKREKYEAMEAILKDIIALTKTPFDDDVINLAAFVGHAVRADKLLNP